MKHDAPLEYAIGSDVGETFKRSSYTLRHSV